MDKLSELIKEAKPLYKTRKRNRAIAKLSFIFLAPILLFFGIFQIYVAGNNLYVSLSQNDLQIELMTDEFNLLR